MKRRIPGLNFEIFMDLVYFLLSPGIVLFYILKRKYNSRWSERICCQRWRKILKEKNTLIWIHGVSLGEVKLAYTIYKNLKSYFPSSKFLLTTITSVGERFLQKHIEKEDYLAYLPLDFSFLMRYIFSRLDIKGVLILETEIWPNFIIEAKKHSAVLGLINARISRKAYPRYRLIKYFLARILRLFDFVCLSGNVARRRFESLGLKSENNYYPGPLKFDVPLPSKQKDTRIEKLRGYLTEGKYILLIAGSTHPGEDIKVFNVYQKIKHKYPQVKLLIAPRHINKIAPFVRCLRYSGYTPEYFSQGFSFAKGSSIFIIDETGYLASLYELADIVFVGGTLIPWGGHNIIEPALFQKAIIIGPYYDNFEEIVWEFLQEKSILICCDEIQFQKSIEALIAKNEFRTLLGKRAYETVLIILATGSVVYSFPYLYRGAKNPSIFKKQEEVCFSNTCNFCR